MQGWLLYPIRAARFGARGWFWGAKWEYTGKTPNMSTLTHIQQSKGTNPAHFRAPLRILKALGNNLNINNNIYININKAPDFLWITPFFCYFS
jgi:hypothetical protein